MRARAALLQTGTTVVLREVVLRDKPGAFLQASGSGTVPCLVTAESTIDESLDIMVWALRRYDPAGWLDMPKDGWEWIERCDGPFKEALDRTKYAARYPNTDPAAEREKAMAYLNDLDRQIDRWIFDRPTLADFAILPFVRQFAFIDKPLFDAEAGGVLRGWLERYLASDDFAAIMPKFAQWQDGDQPILFPPDL